MPLRCPDVSSTSLRAILSLAIHSLVVVAIRYSESSDGSTLDLEDGILSVNDQVVILTGRYKGCNGVVEQVSSRTNKVKVRRDCGEGRGGHGKTWWYKTGQVEELIEEEPEGANEEVGTENKDQGSISLVKKLGVLLLFDPSACSHI